MQSVTSNAVSNAISTSFTEHEVGYWLGRKVYEKTISADIPSYSTALYLTSIDFGITGVVTVVSFDGVYIKGTWTNPSLVMKAPYTFINTTDNKWLNIYIYYNKPNNTFQVALGGTYSTGYYGGGQLFITVKYIKSTTIET